MLKASELIPKESGLRVGHESVENHLERAAQTRLFPVVPRNRTRGRRCKFKQQIADKKKSGVFFVLICVFCFLWVEKAGCLESCGVAILEDVDNLSGDNPKRPALCEIILLLD